MPRLRRARWIPAVAASSALVLGLGAAASTQLAASAAPAPAADPVPAALTEPVAGSPDYPAAPAGAGVVIDLAPEFARDVRRAGGRIVALGNATFDGTKLQAPMAAVFKEGFLLDGGFAIRVGGRERYSCPQMSVDTRGSMLWCGTNGLTTKTLELGEAASSTRESGWIVDRGIELRIANDGRAGTLNRAVPGNPFEAGNLVGELTIQRKRLLQGSWDGEVDDRTGCWIGYYASDNSIWRGWATQALVNRIPKDVGISQYSVSNGTGSLAGPDSPAVAIGQRTPYMEKIGVLDSKRMIRGTDKNTDHWWDTNNYGCNTNAPYVVGQGLLNDKDVKAWRYDGGLRGKVNNPGGAARPQWWAHPRVTNYDGPTGNYSWTCRGVPTGSDDTYWGVKNSGNGFQSDSDSAEAGRARECRDLNLAGMKVTTRYSISKRGAIESRSDQATYPRYCSVENNPLVGCWQEIYPLWDRAWAFQNHIYASVLRASLVSVAQIRVPSDYSETDLAYTKPISWRLTDGDITGAWPNYMKGNDTVDLSGITAPFSDQDWSTVSPFTVPGDGRQFTVSGYGKPLGQQQMTFTLTADTDGTWEWPRNARGRELPRPQVKLTFGYFISNYDDGGSCKDKSWYDDEKFGDGRNNDASGGHCLQGSVPTIWPLPQSSGNYWKRVPDAFVKDKDDKWVKNVPTTTFEQSFLASCLQSKELTVQDNSSKTAPNVGADYTWNIRIAGTVTSFSGC